MSYLDTPYDLENVDPFDPSNYTVWDDGSGNERPMFDDELAQELCEQNEWDNPYDGGFLYSGDKSEYEGLTIHDCPPPLLK